MEIKSLANTSFDELFEAFEQAFADYEVQINKAEHLAMLKRRGFNPELSFAAFDRDKIVSFTCNGIGHFYGVSTAYDTGTGTLKEYRGKGLATEVFEYSIPYLKEAGIKEYLLEVLQHNTGAVSVYSKLGFKVFREFNYFQKSNEEIKTETESTNELCEIKPINLNEFTGIILGFWDFPPSWQNSFESIKRAPDAFIYLGAFIDSKFVGYGVFEPTSGDVTQIAVNKNYRRKGIGSLLFRQMLDSNKHDSVKIINTDITCDSITGFLASKNIGISGKQFEMIKKL